MRSRITWIVSGVLLLAFAVFCCLYFIPKTTPIDMTLDAVKTDKYGNELGTVPIHIRGAIKEYLFRPDTLALHIDDFDLFYDIYPWTNRHSDIYPWTDRDSDDYYEDFKLYWDSHGYMVGIIFGASSTVTGEHSVWINVSIREDLKKWQFYIGSSIYADDATRDEIEAMGLNYIARLE